MWQYFISRDEKEQQQYLESVSPSPKNNDKKGKGGISFTQVKPPTSEIDPDQFTEADGEDAMYYKGQTIVNVIIEVQKM